MIVTRFKYDYNIYDILLSFLSLFYDFKSPEGLFEKMFPKTDDFYYTRSARQAIKIALTSFNLKKGAKIGIQPYTCSSVFAAIKSAGYQPFFIDINESLSLDIKDFKNKVGQIDALIITHIFGYPSNIKKIKELAGNIPIIEDCSHALLSKYNGQYVGSFCDISVFSFGNGKLPSMGANGLLVVNNGKYTNEIRDKIRNLIEPSFYDEAKNIIGSYLQAFLHSKIIGFFFGKCINRLRLFRNNNNISYLDDKSAAFKSVSFLLARKQNRILKNIHLQINNGKNLSLNINKNYKYLSAIESGEANFFAFVIFTDSRDDLYDYLLKHGIEAGKHFQFANNWAMNMGNLEGNCPNFDRLFNKILTIPCHYGVSKVELNKIIYFLNIFITKQPYEKSFG